MTTPLSAAAARPPEGRRLRTDTSPWYRQFWPWFLIALPAISVAASFATLAIAIRHADTVVSQPGYELSRFAEPTPLRRRPPATGAGGEDRESGAVSPRSPEGPRPRP